MIAIRTHANSKMGVGHLMRMSIFARELSEIGHEVVLLLDSENSQFSKFINDLQVNYLYSNDNIGELDEEQDANRCIEYLLYKSVEIVIVDSYLLGLNWETRIIEAGYKVTVFDDLGDRKHNCNFLVDPKWCGNIDTFKRYESLVPDHCQRLLGPAYSILATQYRQNQIPTDNHNFNIMLSLGGGGDLNIIADLIEELLSQFDSNDQTFKLFPVVGPLAYNKDKIIELAKNDSRIQTIDKPSSLYEHYLKTSLFIGALGTSLYELSSLSIPALTFSLASNQENKIEDLEDFGHFFHLSINEFQQISLVAKLTAALKGEIHRLKELCNNPVVTVDGLGVKRIAEAIFKNSNNHNLINDIKNHSVIKDHDYIILSENISIRKVVDSDINHYLDWRNWEENRKNMTIKNTIPRINHYIWWFSNERERYVIEQNGIKKLYIWHQKVEFNQQPYMIGGWFVCGQEVSLDIVAVALQWQLEFTSKVYPDAIWLAIIKKTNKFVNLLNKYVGFEAIKESDQGFDAIKHYFNNASHEEFNYLKFSQTFSRK